MAVAVKTTAIKASAMDDSGALFRDGIEPTAMVVSKSTVPVESATVPKPNLTGHGLSETRNTAQKTHCGWQPW